MSVPRVLAVVALGAAVVVCAVLLRGPQPYTITAEVTDAGQLVEGNEVRIGAGTAGKVSAVRLTAGGHAELDLSIDEASRPLRRGTRLAIRSTSLPGSANHYVTLTPGALSSPPLQDGDRIRQVDTTSPVDFDAFLNTLDAPTRTGLAQLITGAGTQYGSRIEKARRTLDLLAPTLSSSTAVLQELSRDRAALGRLIARGAVASRAVADHSAELTDLISATGTTARAIADQGTALGQTLDRLPATFTHATDTFTGLRTTLDDVDGLVAAAKPGTKDLAPFLTRLDPLLKTAAPTVDSLAALVRSPGAANDLVDLVSGLPQLAGTTGTVAPRAIKTMDGTQDIADTLLAYTPDIAAAATQLNAAAATYDANGHYLRLQPSLFALGFDASKNQLVSHPDSERLTGLQLGAGARCPGGAVRQAAVKAVPGCSLSTLPPGS